MTGKDYDRVHVTAALHERRERVFLLFAGLFIGAMAMLNIIGITKFLVLFSIPWPSAWSPTWLGNIGRDDPVLWAGVTWFRFRFEVPAGVLPYPITFLCTDFISEFYGRRRANYVVLLGLVVNLFVIGTLWTANRFPAVPNQLPWQEGLLKTIYGATSMAVAASMAAYLTAQFVDVFLFHFWKKLTRGRHLWLRNNGSTMVSQMVDTVAVVTITFGAAWRRGEVTTDIVLGIIVSSYVYKFVVAAADTVPFYAGVRLLGRYLQIDPTQEHQIDAEETGRRPQSRVEN
ncbi:MAG: queuosine precursor transporter [Phycisphaerae bacterium]|nr:queuosine precursor transporter [Phycisphaerae bacterium]